MCIAPSLLSKLEEINASSCSVFLSVGGGGKHDEKKYGFCFDSKMFTFWPRRHSWQAEILGEQYDFGNEHGKTGSKSSLVFLDYVGAIGIEGSKDVLV